MDTRTRKAIGCFGLLAYLAIYALLAASLGVWLAPFLPTSAELIYYASPASSGFSRCVRCSAG